MRHADEVCLELGRHSQLVLRASLRAAAQLERRYGFPKLLAACGEGNLTIIADVIETSSNTSNFLKSIADMPLIEVMPPLLQAIPAHILALAGIDPNDNSESQSGEKIPFPEYHAKLYRIGTGWLGWSPETTWNATAPEILEAYSGHIEMLRAIHGSAEDDEPRRTEKPNEAKLDRAGLAKLRSMAMVR